MSDKSPTAEITCACGRLAPESGGKGKVRGQGWSAGVCGLVLLRGPSKLVVDKLPVPCSCAASAPRRSQLFVMLASPPGQKRVAVPADFYRFLQRGWTAHCAAQRAKQARSKGAATGGGSCAAAGGGGGSGVWEAGGEGESVEVICLDSPTAGGPGQAAAAAAAAEVKEEGGEAKRPRRRGRAAAGQQEQQAKQAKQEPKEEPDVVMLDADSSDEPVDVMGERAWEEATCRLAAGSFGVWS